MRPTLLRRRIEGTCRYELCSNLSSVAPGDALFAVGCEDRLPLAPDPARILFVLTFAFPVWHEQLGLYVCSVTSVLERACSPKHSSLSP